MAALSKWVPIGDSPDKSENIMKPPKLTTIDKIGGIFCHICHVTFGNKKDFDSHYSKHNSGSAEFVYTCVQCRKEIVGYPSFRGHCYLQHVMKDKFKCEQCGKVFSKLCVLKSHVKAVHQYKCPICDHEFQTQKQLAMHQIVHKNDQNGPPYDCQTCGQQIDGIDACESHIEDHSHMSYSCPICDETIAEISNAASHLTKHFGDVLINEPDVDEGPEITNDSSIDLLGGIFCCHCEQIYKARPDFDNHFTLEHPDEQIVYACNICGKEYSKYFVFANHCYYHYSKGRFQCEVCSKPFPRLSLLVTHMEAYHADGRDLAYPFTCSECDHGFKTQRRLKDHYRTAHNILHNQCLDKDCRKTFETPKELATHLKEHKSTDNYCRTCGLRFSSLAACEKHLQLHRKKAYHCPVCNRSYGEKYLVMKHVNQHFSSVLHICNICGKVYNARSRLNNHMKVHNESRRHTCTYCGKGFTKPYLLSQHLNIHTGLKPYKCTVCPKTFANHPNLMKHLKCMHSIHKIDIKLCYNPNFPTKIPNPLPNTKIEKIHFETNKVVYDESSEIPDNNNTENDVEINKNPPTSETSSDVYNNHSFDGSDEWKSDTIDPSVMKMLEENINNIDAINANNADISELENALWVQSPNPMSPAVSANDYLLSPVEAACVPREYGPEFVNTGPGGELVDTGPGGELVVGGEYVHLDEHLLPHIDPRLIANPAPRAPWEPPVFTKVYQEYPDLADTCAASQKKDTTTHTRIWKNRNETYQECKQ